MDQKELKKIIKESADANKVLRIKYKDLKNKDSIRNVEPYEIRGNKLWAYCRKRKGIRQFELERIQTAKVTNYTYFPKWPTKFNDDLEKIASYAQSNKWLYDIPSSVFGVYYEAEVE